MKHETIVGLAGVGVIVAAVTAGTYFNKETTPEIQGLISQPGDAKLFMNRREVAKIICKARGNDFNCWTVEL